MLSYCFVLWRGKSRKFLVFCMFFWSLILRIYLFDCFLFSIFSFYKYFCSKILNCDFRIFCSQFLGNMCEHSVGSCPKTIYRIWPFVTFNTKHRFPFRFTNTGSFCARWKEVIFDISAAAVASNHTNILLLDLYSFVN